MDSGPQYRFDAFSTVHTKTFEKDRIARCDVRLQTHAPVHMTSSFFDSTVFERPHLYDM